jgi:hypothetical protein
MVNLILSWIPQQYIYIAVVFFVLLLITIFYVLSRLIRPYILLCTFITVGTILFANYKITKLVNECQYNIKTVTEQLLQLENKSTEVTERIVVKYKDRIKYIQQKQKEIKADIKQNITEKEDNECKIPESFIELHNRGAK